jgi:SAM-dependent methyltransferase
MTHSGTTGLRSAARRVLVGIPLFGRPAVDLWRRHAPWRRRSPSIPLVEGYPSRFVVEPPPGPVPDAWPEPPVVPEPIRITTEPAADSDAERAFDIELFESLNAEYADLPLVAHPQEYDDDALLQRAHSRLLGVHRSIDLGRKRVLEFGCGAGYEVWVVSHQFDSEAWGVDVREYAAWPTLADERTHLLRADLSAERPFEEDFFDRIMSFAVFEHVEHPFAALAELYRVLKPGGFIWLWANLYRGPMASHRYNYAYFPFPHLLFTDSVFREYCRRHGLPVDGAAWVNRLSWAEYERHFLRLGFRIRRLRFSEHPLDEAFYRRFESILGRYPRTDLTRDFFEVVLEKPRR